ncbi:ATP-binding protein [Fonticella tunisiensis]|uniref:Replicative DNA helicase loader DnaI n=1 Tax=Fonticella tunisiensis TaxID=1096341 RepID=A0A4R7KWH5_9CLOT|nr:ATP-binding protein [Fonticella tunisiensis]TDT63246.1 replicative DNA helicase loader DnaI [Fonticella tunisiensis]
MSDKYTLEVLKEYERLQDEAKNKQRQRQIEIYNKFPRIRDIDNEIARTGFEIASSIFKGIDIENYIKEQKKRITDLKIEKAEILSSHNYPVDYLEIQYKCNKCKDTGYIGNEKCSCFKQKLIDRHYKQSNLRDILNEENFDTFDFSLYSDQKYKDEPLSPRKNIEEIFTRCVNFTKNFDNTNENLFFFGGSGLGKTFLSNCIAKELLDKGKVVIYQTSSNLIQILRSLRFEDNAPKDQIEDFIECDLLIIDDLGTEPNTPYAQSELFNIINTRIIKGKKILISTNFPLEDLLSIYPERITSRILGHFTICEFYGDDIRIKKSINKRKARA